MPAGIASTTPKLRVMRGDHDPIEVQTSNPDLVRWDLTRAKRKWPSFEDGPFLWLTFISWAAARRLNLVDAGVTFEVWQTEVLGVEPVDEDDFETGTGTGPDPTSPAPDRRPDSASS